MKKLDDLLKNETDKRLLRLFSVGCCRHIWDRLIDERSRTAVEVAESFADGQATLEELKKAHDENSKADYDAVWVAVHNTSHYTVHAAVWVLAHNTAYVINWCVDKYLDIQRQLELYHCLFTKIVFSTTSQNAINLAKFIYQERNWTLMPILGDALEEAGATEEVISHCKETEHARGCWVVDNILGKR